MVSFIQLLSKIALTGLISGGLVISLAPVMGLQAQFPPLLLSDLPNQWENPPNLSTDLGFEPPPRVGKPPNRQGGGTRGNCLTSEGDLTLLVPASGIGATVAAYPTFMWYLPKLDFDERRNVAFVLKDATGETIYETSYTLQEDGSDGLASDDRIVSLSLPSRTTMSPLKIGEEYTWEVTLGCGLDSSSNITAQSKIVRVAADPQLAAQLPPANPAERLSLYVDNRLWYDAIAMAATLHHTMPNENNVSETWNNLLQSVDLEQLSTK